jgi:protoporphyrinogen oxidase
VTTRVGTLIIGAGPAGLGAAHRLRELGDRDWLVVEAEDRVGGLAKSHVDAAGFTWDVGGHVMFSSSPYFNAVTERVLADDALMHARECWIRTHGRFIPYPFQNNIGALPHEAAVDCLDGLYRASLTPRATRPASFDEWITATFGEGIRTHFMDPYNRKVWAQPLERMSADWIAERVAVVEPRRVLELAMAQGADASWGPNASFRYPLHGSTMPLDRLARVSAGCPAGVRAAADGLTRSRGVMIGFGVARGGVSDRNWVYFPDPEVPFYRLTFLSNYSPHIVPGAATDRYSALLVEVSASEHRPVDDGAVAQRSLEALIREGVLEPEDEDRIASVWQLGIPYSYPVPTLDRDRRLAQVEGWLAAMGVRSVGRFGAWRYEVGNMDHSFMMGVNAVERLLDMRQSA